MQTNSGLVILSGQRLRLAKQLRSRRTPITTSKPERVGFFQSDKRPDQRAPKEVRGPSTPPYDSQANRIAPLRMTKARAGRSHPHFLQRTHVRQELAIRLGLAQLVDQQFHRFHGRKRVQHLAQHPDAGQIFLRNQQLFLTRAGALNIDGREGALVDQLAVENDFRCCRCL